MRLGQLARKLALPPSEITEFLASQQINIADGANARLDEKQVELVLQRFAPELLASPLTQEPADDASEVPVTESVQLLTEEPVKEEIKPVDIQEPVVETASAEKSEEKIETIKAPKVALAGLKVLGKIEIPGKKKKSETPAAEETTPATETAATETNTPVRDPQKPDRRRPQDQKRRDQRDQRPKKNPIALAREREARLAEEKKQEEQRLKKELRTQNYMKRVQAKAPTKAARLIKEDVIDMSSVDLRPAPKTWLGKFWRWFRS
jgi:hypothetical protein